MFREGEEILTVRDPSQIDALHAQIEALHDDRLREKLGAAARQVALRHTFEHNVDEILSLYGRPSGRRLAA